MTFRLNIRQLETKLHGTKLLSCIILTKTRFNNVLSPTLITVFNTIRNSLLERNSLPQSLWIVCGNAKQDCRQPWSMWAAQHCSSLFSATLNNLMCFLLCTGISHYSKLPEIVLRKFFNIIALIPIFFYLGDHTHSASRKSHLNKHILTGRLHVI